MRLVQRLIDADRLHVAAVLMYIRPDLMVAPREAAG